MADQNLPADFEDQRNLAANYEPSLTGPNVSAKKSITELVDQYATGHEAYQAKTKSIAQDYHAMRRVKGDRKCGWRAVYFVYCELLLALRDGPKIDAEKQRISDLVRRMDILGNTQKDLFEDMCTDSVNALMENLKAWLASPQTAAQRLEAFFDSEDAVHVLYGLRLIAALHLKENEEYFSMFLDQPVESYLNFNIFLPDEEIDETGLRALNDIFLAPAGLALEILNLHDNPGTKADLTTYPQPEHPAVGGIFSVGHVPTVRLLFTPGHYDIIYKSSDEAS